MQSLQSADSVNCFKNRLDNFWKNQPETEVKWYFDSIEEIVIVYISETGLEALLPAPATLYHSTTSTSTSFWLLIAHVF